MHAVVCALIHYHSSARWETSCISRSAIWTPSSATCSSTCTPCGRPSERSGPCRSWSEQRYTGNEFAASGVSACQNCRTTFDKDIHFAHSAACCSAGDTDARVREDIESGVAGLRSGDWWRRRVPAHVPVPCADGTAHRRAAAVHGVGGDAENGHARHASAELGRDRCHEAARGDSS